MNTHRSSFTSVLLALSLAACDGGGGGGGGSGGGGPGPAQGVGPEPTEADKEVITYATVGSDGSFARVDLVDGGTPVFKASDLPNPVPVQPGELSPNPEKRAFLNKITSLDGGNFDAIVLDTNGDGIADSGFESYETGVAPGKFSDRILGANNLYDLFQTTTGTPILGSNTATPPGGGPPFTGGDVDLNGTPDGGPGIFRNVNPATSLYPGLPTLPNAMGDATPGSGSRRGPSPSDQHQFIQIVFPYNLDEASLFNFLNDQNSFLGDSAIGATPNVFVERRWVTRAEPAPDGTLDTINIVDHTSEHSHVSGVAIIGGVCAIPRVSGQPTLTEIDIDISNIPEGAKPLIGKKNVLTYIAHESPQSISLVSQPTGLGYINSDNTVILPDPTMDLGGRVFGANITIPSSVNDFETDADQAANKVGFVSFRITRLRSGGKGSIGSPYFHTFPVSQENVGGDPTSVAGTFNRGPAIEVNELTQEPMIDVLDIQDDYLNPYDPTPTSDLVNVVSTRARFRVDFDKEVIPNSVGFSRRHTIHTVLGKGVVFPFNGNTRFIGSPAQLFVQSGLGAPLAPSIYLAVNMPANVAVNNPFSKDVNSDDLLDDGVTPILPNSTPDQQNALQGLYPSAFSQGATLPRGVVPLDIYPVNQNNLQAYVVEPLVELPPNTTITLGVCMQGLGMSNNALPVPTLDSALPTPGVMPALPVGPPTNFGNYTRSGTVFTPFQGVSPVGLGNLGFNTSAVEANRAIIKVNAGPMDLQGLLFFGGTTVALDRLIDGDINDGGETLSNDQTDGGFNVSRSFRVGSNNKQAYVNAPVVPQAIAVGFGGSGAGVLDLAGTGFTTNKPGGGSENTGNEGMLITTRYLATAITGKQPDNSIASATNWNQNGSIVAGNHQQALGLLSRYTAGPWADLLGQTSYETDFAVGAAIGIGQNTETPGINEGSSGYETMVRNSFGEEILTDPKEIGQVRDMVVGNFLDSIFFDKENPFAIVGLHRSYNTPALTAVENNTTADPPAPNPPPLRFPVGLPHTAVLFNQDNVAEDPFIIEGNEILSRDTVTFFNDGTGMVANVLVNTYIQLNPVTNASNPQSFDAPHLPNAGYIDPFGGATVNFVQTGPMAKTCSSNIIALVNVQASDTAGLQIPIYQSRQQIGNFLFVADGVNKKLHAVNSNTMRVIESLALPDPYGLGLSPDLDLLFVSNEGDDSVSMVDADPRSPTFMTELKRIPVGSGPRAVAVTPNNEDCFVLNRLGNSISIIDLATGTLRKTIVSTGIKRPWDITVGQREVSGGPAFQSGTFHGFISNHDADSILVYEGGPAGVAGIGFDDILGEVKPNEPATIGQPQLVSMDEPKGVQWDPVAPLDPFAGTIGCFVAHQDPATGLAVVSRVTYTKDSSPGQQVFNTTTNSPGFSDKIFEVTQQYISSFSGTALDVALPDFRRENLEVSNFGTNSDLFNAGATLNTGGSLGLPRNSKYPLLDVAGGGLTTAGPRWRPDRVYLAIGGGVIDVFDLDNSTHLNTIFTGPDPQVLMPYFKQ